LAARRSPIVDPSPAMARPAPRLFDRDATIFDVNALVSMSPE
jgi:hypothetical protein